jgi:hypothetical protein
MMSPEAESLLAKNRERPPRPSEGARVRMKDRVLVRAGVAVAATAAVGTATSASAGTAASAGFIAKVLASWKIGAVVIALGALGSGAAVLMTSNDQPPPVAPTGAGNASPPQVAPPDVPPRVATAADAAAPETAAPETKTEVVPEPPPVAPETSPKAPPRPSGKPIAKADDLATEADLLARAQSALTSGDAKKAIALCDEHAARFPNGALAGDRDRLRARAKAAQ